MARQRTKPTPTVMLAMMIRAAYLDNYLKHNPAHDRREWADLSLCERHVTEHVAAAPASPWPWFAASVPRGGYSHRIVQSEASPRSSSRRCCSASSSKQGSGAQGRLSCRIRRRAACSAVSGGSGGMAAYSSRSPGAASRC